jgi:23S rRNA (cytosine1962-C5)-methyltransferase
VPAEVARRVRDGHPWIFADALRGRQVPGPAGQVVDVTDPDGGFVARAVLDPDGSPVLRVLSRVEGARLDRDYLTRRVASCLRLRQRLLSLGPLSCCRLVNGDSEGIPTVTVDRYASHLVVCTYSAVAEAFQQELVATLAEQLTPQGIYLQRRHVAAVPGRPRPGAELVWGSAAPPEVIVAEGRTRFVVDVSAPSGTGIYPDMRLGREAVAQLAGGRRVINCFSYTGAFSVVAALHGAREVVSVDAAARAHGRARRNLAENRIDEQRGGCEFITGDTFAALARLAERKRRFDLVVLDPPTFSSAKGKPFTALKDYGELVAAALTVTEEGGLLCVASNAAKLPAADLDRALGRGASLAGRELVTIAQLGLPPDFPVSPAFPEGQYLKVILAQLI